MDPLGPKIRKQRQSLGLTLDELAGRTGISKPYLSLIETQRVMNPPSDEKLRKLEQALGFPSGELLSQAHLQRTPSDVRAMLAQLAEAKGSGFRVQGSERVSGLNPEPRTLNPERLPTDLDQAYLSGILQELVDRSAGNIETITTNAVPVVNKVAAGYPTDFTDLSYPRGVADDYVGCPEVRDKDAFAARVYGDSMEPKYRAGDIVIFSPAATAKSGDDCFIRFEDGHSTFKRVFFESDDAGNPAIRLQPRNEKYRPQFVAAERVTGIYKAMYRYQTVDDD